LKLAILCRVLWPAGTQRIAIEELRELVKRPELEPSLVFFRAGPRSDLVRARIQPLPYTVVCQNPSRLLPMWGFMMNWAHGTLGTHAYTDESALDISGLIHGFFHLLQWKPDVVLAHDQFTALSSLGYHILTGRPYFVYLHEGPLEDPAKDLPHLSGGGKRRVKYLGSVVGSLVLRRAAGVLANSDATARSAKAAYPWLKEVGVAPPGAPKVEEPTKWRPGGTIPPLVLSVSTWDRGRHPEAYLQVARKLRSGNVALVGTWRYGNTVDRDILETASAAERRTGKFAILGEQTEDSLRDLFRRSSVFLRFGFEEFGPGMGVLEALSYGVPVVVNRSLGSSKLVEDLGCGVVLDDADAEKAAMAIDEITTNAPLWMALHKGAIQAANRLSWTAHSNALAAYLGLP
jgi:glycosyltransferase involved in cell wall biosynthesis